MFKFWKFKKSVAEEKKKVFAEMQKEQNHEKWKNLKEKHDAYDKISHPGGHISRETVISTGASVAMLLLVLHYEKLDIITSKAWGWIKPRKF